MANLPIHCSNILYNQAFNTDYDFTMSFTYTMNTSGTDPVNNYGFGVFFVNGSTNTLQGGGVGPGLGVVSSTGTVPTGTFAIVGFDITGQFCTINSISPFATGIPAGQANNDLIGLRVGPSFQYINSVYVDGITPKPNIFGPIGPTENYWSSPTIRVGVRRGFREIEVASLNDKQYVTLATFQTNLSSTPSTAKVGIGYSGDTLFQIQNLTLNYT